MRTSVRLLVLVWGTAFLAGCQSLHEPNPYEYRFTAAEAEDICLLVDTESSVATALDVKKALEEKGLKAREITLEDYADCKRCVRFQFELGGISGGRLEKASMEFVRHENGQTYTIGVVGMNESPAGLSTVAEEDPMVMIRALVDRLFPDPIPWNTAEPQ